MSVRALRDASTRPRQPPERGPARSPPPGGDPRRFFRCGRSAVAMRRIASSYVRAAAWRGAASGWAACCRAMPRMLSPNDAGAEGGSQPAGRAVGPGVGEVLRGKFDADGAFRPPDGRRGPRPWHPRLRPGDGQGRAGRARGAAARATSRTRTTRGTSPRRRARPSPRPRSAPPSGSSSSLRRASRLRSTRPGPSVRTRARPVPSGR